MLAVGTGMAGRQYQPILETAEQLLGMMLRPMEVQRQLCERHKISARSAWRYMERVRQHWRMQGADLSHEDRSERKATIRRAAQEQYNHATWAVAQARSKGPDGAVRPEAPRDVANAVRAGNQALKLLLELDGLAEPSMSPTVIVNEGPMQVNQVVQTDPVFVQQLDNSAHDPTYLRRRFDELAELKARQLAGGAR